MSRGDNAKMHQECFVNDFGTGLGYQPVQPIQPIQAPASSCFTFQKWEVQSNHLLMLFLMDQEDNAQIQLNTNNLTHPSTTSQDNYEVEDIQMAACEHVSRFARKLIEQCHSGSACSIQAETRSHGYIRHALLQALWLHVHV